MVTTAVGQWRLVESARKDAGLDWKDAPSMECKMMAGLAIEGSVQKTWCLKGEGIGVEAHPPNMW